MSDARNDDAQAVDFAPIGHIGVITINRPAARNAVNADVAQGIEAAIDRLENDDELWVGVLTGAPPTFCAGADLKVIQAGRRDELRTPRGGFAGIVARERAKPIIAAVEGQALAGGTEICLACDLIVASRTAQFGIPEVKRGLVAAGGGLFRLPRRLPLGVALELAMTGEPLDADRAYHFGLVNRLADPGDALSHAMDVARQIESNAPLSVRLSRRVVLEAAGEDESAGWRLSEQAMAEALSSADRQEGISAFVEKRLPIWSGR
jgi:enoyl-CoA hydratase